jgi:zeaxanthin glucosyltransferase
MKAPSILFAMLNESGHLNPTFKLAKALAARGHDVRYLATEDVRATIEGQGFAVEPLFPTLFPPGYLRDEEQLGTLARRRAITSRYRALLRKLAEGAPVAARPDLLLVDVTQTQMALWARRAGVPLLQLNTSLPQTRDPGVPPLRSGAPYGASLWGRATTALAWRKFTGKRRLSAALASVGGMRPPYDLARRAAGEFALPSELLDSETVYMPQLRDATELVLCPEAFDFPRPARGQRHYVESIDLSRAEPELAWGGLSNTKPLVYCALGGQRYRADDVPAFFKRLVRAFRARPDWQLLLAVGQHVRPGDLEVLPNVVVVERAPQLAVLKRAQVMITHGGLGSVKECITHAVPMLGVPLDVDQPGNVARIVHHGLGLASDVKTATQRELLAALEQLLHEPRFRAAVTRMQGSFARAESGQRGVALVERAARPPAGG